MPKDSTKAAQQPRRVQAIQRPTRRLPGLMTLLSREPNLGYALLAVAGFIAIGSVIVNIASDAIALNPQRIAGQTRHARVGFTMVDRAASDAAARELAGSTPRLYSANEALLAEVEQRTASLPEALAAAADLASVIDGVRLPFALDQELFENIRSYVEYPAAETADANKQQDDPAAPATPEVLPEWTEAVERLLRLLRDQPVITNTEYQVELSSRSPIELVDPDGSTRPVSIVDFRDAGASPAETLRPLVERARFPTGTERAIAAYLVSLRDPPTGRFPPTYRFDEQRTSARLTEELASVADVLIDTPAGEPVVTRGQLVTERTLATLRAERDAFERTAPAWLRLLPRLSLTGAVIAVAIAIAAYAGSYNRKLHRNPDRMLGLAALLLTGLAAAGFGTAAAPQLWGLTALAPTLLVTSILIIAYDQRTALAIGSLHALLVCVTLQEPVGTFALLLTGVGAAVWTLSEIRDRRTIMRSGLVVGAALLVTTASVSIVDRPLPEGLEQLVFDAALAGLGGLVVAAVTLALVSSVESLFDITTGMTLIELRDPKQPLLRELQQRAPGTYNHSLNVASIAEQAADAIGADSLLTYVGALYHDVGKMNKPEYFIENQTPGENRHEKLSPAMSLLVIVGHVKDGVELAREFQIPRPLHHFIEAHHGTTLVEYFYHRAVKEAETDVVLGEPSGGIAKGSARGPDEFDYRYPGPKPASKEVAILMLADAVESAARALTEPTPARIENLVKTIARKRLDDGQFDECALTLRELVTITESVTKSMTAIYHGRIAYPSGESAARPA
ncbi:MAG: HDIG domain-containing metalloprotein [Planctomycetota bacterium]